MPQVFQSIAASATMHVHVNARFEHDQGGAGIASSWLQISNGNCIWPIVALVPDADLKKASEVTSMTSNKKVS